MKFTILIAVKLHIHVFIQLISRTFHLPELKPCARYTPTFHVPAPQSLSATVLFSVALCLTKL